MNYLKWLETYSYATNKWECGSFYGNDDRIIITETIERQRKSGSKWETTGQETKHINGTQYVNIIDAIPWFRNLGGTETVQTNYTRWGRVPVKIFSTSPDKQDRTIRTFKF